MKLHELLEICSVMMFVKIKPKDFMIKNNASYAEGYVIDIVKRREYKYYKDKFVTVTIHKHDCLIILLSDTEDERIDIELFTGN